MHIQSRWSEPVPNCSLQKWIFGSAFEPLPDRVAFLDAENPETSFLTFSGYRELAKRIALGLKESGLSNGDRVLLFSSNHVYFPAIFLGVLMAGGVFTGANPTFTSRELAYQLKDSGASFMIAAKDAIATAVESAASVSLPADRVFFLDSSSPEARAKPSLSGARHWLELVAHVERATDFEWVEPADPWTTTCCLNYSSGTTGLPKGVEISHRSYVANGSGVLKVASLKPNYEEVKSKRVGLCFLPLYHAYGQTSYIANAAKEGTPVYVMPKFDFIKMLGYVQRYRITSLLCVPSIVISLVKDPRVRDFDLTSLEHVGSGATSLPPDIARETERYLKKPDLIVRQGWGMTELTCTALSWDPTSARLPGSVGELMPNCSAKLVDDSGAEVTVANTRGELWIAGPTVMRGYWGNPTATASTVLDDGQRWLRTGDIAYVSSYKPGGFFYIVDRKKELIKVQGHQVAPAELEALLLECNDVADAAVVGVTIQGRELPRAYVVRAPGSAASEKDVASWMDGKVTSYKRLKGGLKFTDTIPKNPSGKILRKLLREKAKIEVGDREPPSSRLS